MIQKKDEKLKRLVPLRKFPPYKFVQGKDFIHPNKEGGYRFGQEEPFIAAEKLSKFHLNDDFLYAIDLYNHKYYWEAHVWFEAFWQVSKKKSSKGDFFKALILICAGAIKIQLNKHEVALKQFSKASEILNNNQFDFNVDISVLNKVLENYISTRTHQNINYKELFN